VHQIRCFLTGPWAPASEGEARLAQKPVRARGSGFESFLKQAAGLPIPMGSSKVDVREMNMLRTPARVGIA